jgi:hypothetical protein
VFIHRIAVPDKSASNTRVSMTEGRKLRVKDTKDKGKPGMAKF